MKFNLKVGALYGYIGFNMVPKSHTSEISELAHKKQEPIFITKNGYSDLVVMSAELYERFAQINKIDQAIYEAEKEVEEGAEPISMNSAMERLNQKYYG